MKTQVLDAQSHVTTFTDRRGARSLWARLGRSLGKGILAGALVLASQPIVQAQAPTVRNGRDGTTVMQFNYAPESTASEPSRAPLQQVQHTPELMQVGPAPMVGGMESPQSQQAFNIGPVQPSQQQVQLVAERRGFFDKLFPWMRRDGMSSNYEQPVEPPNQYQSNPLPPNSETDYGPAMSGFNHYYRRPQTPPPRPAQGAAPSTTPSTTPPPGYRPAPAPSTPPQASGTTTTNDGRELPIFQFGNAPRPSSSSTFTPPGAPRPEPSATPAQSPTTPSTGPSITPITPMPPVLPLNTPATNSPPVNESSTSQEIDAPQFEDPFIVPQPGAAGSATDDAASSGENVSAFPPPPTSTTITQTPALTAPVREEPETPEFVPPGAPRIELPESTSTVNGNASPQLSANPPALTAPQSSANIPPAFVSGQEAEESNEDKLDRIRERRGQTGLKGFCPVMLRDHRELVDARPEFAVEFNGHTFYVSSAEAQAIFAADPSKYAPALGGADIIHSDLTGELLPGSLDHAVWYRGRLYMFATAETMETFVAAPSAHRTDL